MREVKIPIDSAVPEFMNVERIPDAAPRCRAGTLLMTEAELGEPNRPLPTPLAVMSSAKPQYGKSTGRNIRPRKLPPKTSIPAVAKPRAPNRSDRCPDSGPATRTPAVSGSRKMPAHSGVSL
jgi:hypothetical protein